MATSNFRTQKLFNLMARDFEEYDADTNESFFDDFEYKIVSDIIDELNDCLEFFEITLEDGYYAGVQTFIVDKEQHCDYFDFEPTDFLAYYDEYDGSEIFRNYGYNKHILRKKILKEIDKINTKYAAILKDYGFKQYEITARFSNGETWYAEV